VTNGYWAKSIEAGRRRLRELAAAGLNELNISTGDFHQEYVAEEVVINAACLGIEEGLAQVLIVVEMQQERKVTRERLLTDPRIAKLAQQYAEDRFKIIESPWMPMNPDETIPQPALVMLNRSNVHLRSGCPSMFSTLVVTPHRKLGFCCGLTREKIPELNTDLDGTGWDSLLEEGGNDFMKIWIAVDGPEKILAWAASKDPEIYWEDRYAHHCHACLGLFADARVRSAIRAHYRERIDDVVMRYCLLLRVQQSVDFPKLTESYRNGNSVRV
jgi:hypothetical protein